MGGRCRRMRRQTARKRSEGLPVPDPSSAEEERRWRRKRWKQKKGSSTAKQRDQSTARSEDPLPSKPRKSYPHYTERGSARPEGRKGKR